MKLWKKCLSGLLSAAMLVGMLPTSALAVHAPGTDAGDLGLAQECTLFINETESDTELQSAEDLGYKRPGPYTPGETYPYVIPITEGQQTAEIYSKARVTMSSQTARYLMDNVQNLDVTETRFVVFMAIDENMTLTGDELLFNSTFLMPDEEQMNEFAQYNEKSGSSLSVTKATSEEYDSDYSGGAEDMGWVISGDLDALYIPNPDGETSGNSNADGFSFQDNFFAEEGTPYYDYVKSRGSGDYFGLNAGEKLNDLWSDFTNNGDGKRVSNVKLYAIPVKLNWFELASAEDKAREVYKNFAAQDWMCPMQLSVPENLSKTQPYDGIKIDINVGNPTGNDVNLIGDGEIRTAINAYERKNFGITPDMLPAKGIDSFIPTASDIGQRNNTEYNEPVNFVNSMPMAGAIVGSIKSTTGGFIGNDVQTMQTGHIYIQFTKPVTGNIVVEKTVMGLDNLTDGQKAELSDALNKEYQMTATSADKEVEQTATAALVLDEETGGYKFTATFEDLSTEHGTYTVTVDGEDELKAALEDVGLFQQSYTVSGGEDIDLANYYQLTRNADGTVNTSGLIDEDTVPTVTVTSTYGTEKPVAPTVTLTYDPNGGDGPDKEFTQDLVDGKAEFTVIENPFTRDEVNGITYSFTGWNTRADGTGTDYAPDSTITLTEDETLYAQWKAEGEEPPVETSDTALSKTLSGNLDENGETNVTLSVPSDGYKQTVDVVLAVDCTSVLEHYGDAIIENIGTLGDELLEEDVNLSVGVVAFGRESKVVHELTALNQGNSEHWASDIAADIWENQDWYLSNEGTNIQGGIRMAQDVLNRSTSGADANHKYIVLITDGGAYWYCRSDTDDTPVNTAHKGDKLQSMGNMDANGDVGSHQNDSAYLRHVEAGGDFASFMEQYGTQIEESAAGKAFSLEETMAAQEAGSATEDPALKEVWDNAFTTEQVNDPSAYPFLNMERGTYFAAQELLNAKEQGTHIVTIGYPYTAGTFLESLRTVSADFREWTGTVGDYYDGNNLGNAFSDLADQITYFVDAGSYVIDQMGSGEDEGWKYNFDFINDAQYLKLTVGGETLKVADLGNNSYGFGDSTGSADGKNYPFVLTYTPEQDGKNDSFQLDINVPVLASEPVQLTYRVKQVNEEDGNTHGQYDPDGSQENNGLLTNNSAVLHPKDGPAMEFPKPTVSVGAIRIQPADITIYTGGDGYESVVTGSGNDLGGTNNGLPEPGFYITLPAEVNEWLLKNANEKDIVINDQGHEVVDLSEYLTFAYDDGKGTTRTWELERYDTNDNDNNSMAYEKFIYRIKPAVVNDEEIPIRLQFTNEDGSYTNSDDFTVSLDQLYQDYEMTIYAGDLNQGLVKAVLTVGNEKKEFSSAVDTGLLKIRGVNDEDPINEVNTGAPTSEVNEITAYVPEDANFYINSSKLEVANPDDVALLVDSIVPDENNTLYHSAVDKFAEITSSQNYQLQYMDLVDTSNGNAYVTTDKAVDIYWPYPEGTDRNTEFYVVHYQGMDREDEGALGSGSYEDEMVLYSEDNGKLETTDHGIKFTVESFSPFALFWGESGDPDWPPVDPDPDPDPDPNPDPDPGDKPELNTEDHYAYIVGYPDGNVKPEGNITRAEVATIFFRLLTDESRDEFWSQTNDYTDVPADAWYNNAVSTLSNAGIIDGYEDGTFKPDGNITRAEFATIAVRFFEATYDGGDLFSDIAGHWAQDYINEAANAGIVDGYPDGTFRPQQYITRAEAMTMVNRTIDRHPDADHLLDDMIVWPDNPETAWYYEQVQEATNSHEYTMNTDDEQNPYEIWTELLPVRDWAQLEKEWSDAHSGQSGGDVV